MKNNFLFILLLTACLNFLNLCASSRTFLLHTPQFQGAIRRQLSSNVSYTPKPTSLLSGYKSSNSPNFTSRFFGKQSSNLFTNKTPIKFSVPKVIAATLVLFETKHLLTSYYREKEIASALEQIKNEPWEDPSKFQDLTKKRQHTHVGAASQAELKLFQEKAIPLYKTFKGYGSEKFIDEILAKYSDWQGDKFRHSAAYKEIFKKFKPHEKEQLLSIIEEQMLHRKNKLETLITEPGWFWTIRQKTEFSPAERNSISVLKKEIEILEETKNIIQNS